MILKGVVAFTQKSADPLERHIYVQTNSDLVIRVGNVANPQRTAWLDPIRLYHKHRTNTKKAPIGNLPESINRRDFLKYTAGGTLGAAAYTSSPTTAGFAARKGSKDYGSPKLSESVCSVDDLTLARLIDLPSVKARSRT